MIFWKTRAMDLEKTCKFRVLEYVVFFGDVSGFIFVILGVMLRVICGLNGQKISLKIDQKRDPGRRGPRFREHGHLGVV